MHRRPKKLYISIRKRTVSCSASTPLPLSMIRSKGKDMDGLIAAGKNESEKRERKNHVKLKRRKMPTEEKRKQRWHNRVGVRVPLRVPAMLINRPWWRRSLRKGRLLRRRRQRRQQLNHPLLRCPKAKVHLNSPGAVEMPPPSSTPIASAKQRTP